MKPSGFSTVSAGGTNASGACAHRLVCAQRGSAFPRRAFCPPRTWPTHVRERDLSHATHAGHASGRGCAPDPPNRSNGKLALEELGGPGAIFLGAMTAAPWLSRALAAGQHTGAHGHPLPLRGVEWFSLPGIAHDRDGVGQSAGRLGEARPRCRHELRAGGADRAVAPGPDTETGWSAEWPPRGDQRDRLRVWDRDAVGPLAGGVRRLTGPSARGRSPEEGARPAHRPIMRGRRRPVRPRPRRRGRARRL